MRRERKMPILHGALAFHAHRKLLAAVSDQPSSIQKTRTATFLDSFPL